MTSKTAEPARPKVRTLTKEEIDRRIEGVISAVAALNAGTGAGLPGGGAEELEPRLISAAELVRRMRPFMVWN